ncbi:hypothetical protein [Erwinia sp. OPT-41]|uniref:Transposase n=1 Tax=Erwinia plantamica TaxID=3237104 RepID=A0ABW7CJB5_9GAMM
MLAKRLAAPGKNRDFIKSLRQAFNGNVDWLSSDFFYPASGYVRQPETGRKKHHGKIPRKELINKI